MNELEQAGLKAISGLVVEFCKVAASSITERSRLEIDKLKAAFEVGITDYLSRSLAKYSSVKTLLHRYNPVDICSIYTETSVSFGRKSESEEDFIQKIPDRRNIIVSGIAGSGKSMFMKHLFVRFCKNNIGYIPIFIELRNLPSSDRSDLVEYVYQQISLAASSFTRKQLEICMQNGKVILILDGFDEIEHDFRDIFSKDLLDISYKFGSTPIIMSSRPDETLHGWDEFYVGSIDSLKIDEVNKLIRKIGYEPIIAEEFINKIEEGLYETHSSFLSNPLLCTMMLMTYTEVGEIPTKANIFYSRAFDVLFDRHDRLKPAFRRKFYTTLAVDDFSKVLSIFCARSFFDQRFAFSRLQAIETARIAIEYCGKDVIPEKYVQDLSESISFLLVDGDNLSFIHRSFQEYFTAVFLVEQTFEEVEQAIDNIISEQYGDQVLPLMHQIAPVAMERKYIIKKLNQLCNELDKINISINPLEAFKLFYLGYGVSEDGEIQYFISETSSASEERISEWFRFADLIKTLYPDYGLSTEEDPNFDWSDLASKHAQTRTGDLIFDIDDPSGDDIKNTPIEVHLQKSKESFLALKKKLDISTKERSKFFDFIKK